ncbi:MAG: MltA domain-containing protein [Alphaproteobacteria bacterium]|nr:MltA domain-containing protein [Alphaproteobacteria bacterium]
MRAFRSLPFLVLFLLAACEAEPPVPFRLEPVGFDSLPGWTEDRLEEGLAAFRKGCGHLVARAETAKAWGGVCKAAEAINPQDAKAARAFFENRFTPHRVLGDGKAEGLFTGYYEASLRGAWERDARYRVPVYGRPADLVMVDLGRFREEWRGEVIAGRVEAGALKPYVTRAEIEAGALSGQGLEILWVDDPVDLFFLHIQGSGRVEMKDGSVLHLNYAGKNGHDYRSIGRELIARGEISKDNASMPALRTWLAAHPERMQELFSINPSFVFFRQRQGEGPIGSLGAPLTPGRSLAVDRAFLPLGAPVWLDTVEPLNRDQPLRRLVVAQDTGGAIKGAVRGDFFWGYGEEAERKAGSMKTTGTYYLLLPKAE